MPPNRGHWPALPQAEAVSLRCRARRPAAPLSPALGGPSCLRDDGGDVARLLARHNQHVATSVRGPPQPELARIEEAAFCGQVALDKVKRGAPVLEVALG
jgi:hypothetical protein